MTTDLFAVTMGDPAGIGPEIVVRAAADPELIQPIVAIGDVRLMRRTAQALGIRLAIRTVTDLAHAEWRPGELEVLPVGELPVGIPIGQVDARAGLASFDYVKRAVDLASEGLVAGIVTAPINKESLRLAGVPYPGHTEMLADLTHTPDVAMMLVSNELRVVLVTIHTSLRDAIRLVTVERVLSTIRMAARALPAFGFVTPRVAVAALNPHAGEHGLFGDEERLHIAPAIKLARASGIDASGPFPPDTVFMRARAGEFDVVIAQYHDQGLIPIKYLGIEEGVNVTLGLPFVRVSVDHGTAFDIAGKGIAKHRNLLVAIQQAARLAAVSRATARPHTARHLAYRGVGSTSRS